MSKAINITGKRFGKLIVLHRAGSNTNGKAVWKCKCDCGNVVIVIGNCLRNGHTTSCGCKRYEESAKARKKPWSKRTRQIWYNMMDRCYNPKNKEYNRYGKRGIFVSNEWHNVHGFFKDMGNAPEGLTLDRINTNKEYSKENCRWATMSEQTVNSRKRRDGKNKYRNIVFHPQTKKWRLTFTRDKVNYDFGLFENIEDAVAKRNEFKKSRGELLYE